MSSQHSQPPEGTEGLLRGHPGPPAPPRSRMRAHVLAVVVGLVVTPVALYLILFGLDLLLPLEGASDLTGAGPLLLGLPLLAVLGVVAAFGSSLALGVGGLVWGVLPGLVGLPLLRPFFGTSFAANMADHLLRPLASGLVLATGAALAAGGVACHLARRGGRQQEREEAALARNEAAEAPAPPRSRRWGHIVGVFFSLVLLPPVAVLLGRGTAAALVLGTTLTRQPWQEPSLLAGTALLAVIVMLAGLSSLGTQLAGWLLLAVGTLPVLFAQGQDSLAPLLDALSTVPGGFQLLASGAWFLLGAALTVCGAAAHFARRSGRRYERADRALTSAGA